MSPNALPLPQRLALSYAPRSSRDAVLTLMLLDQRLASILRDKGEVMIAQIKLAWWRDRLGENPANWPKGEPLLERLKLGKTDPAKFISLVDGWERLLDEQLTPIALAEFAGGRAKAWAALCASNSHEGAVMKAANEWALLDLAISLGEGEEAELVQAQFPSPEAPLSSIPKALRPLCVLLGLARRAVRNQSGELLNGPGAAIAALRIGLLGR